MASGTSSQPGTGEIRRISGRIVIQAKTDVISEAFLLSKDSIP